MLAFLSLLLACQQEPSDDPWRALDGQRLIGIANLDDDDGNGVPDKDDADLPADDDLAALVLPALDEGQRLTLSLADQPEAVRVWQAGALLLSEGTPRVEVQGPRPAGTLYIEFFDFLVEARLELAVEDDAGPLAAAAVALRSAPLILNHHLQAGEYELAMEYSGFGGNGAMIADFEGELATSFESFRAAAYGYDVWIQDEIEYATQTAPGLRMDIVLDSIRSQNGQYLDALVPKLIGPGTARLTYGSGRSSSQDYFGNLEVSPPVTVDGVHYPYGRVYWGRNGTLAPHEDLRAMLEAQRVQAPFELDVSWLCVGHVDEFITTLPDPDSDKGFVLWVTDTALGWQLLEAMPPETALSRYASTHGYATAGEIVEDEALRLVNEDLQAEYIEPNLEILKEQLGLDDRDIVRIPALFEENRYCGGLALALIPGTANMTVYPREGEVLAFLPDPFLREDEGDPGSDPLIAEIEALLPAGIRPVWVDDWDTYHAAWGEVHCGSNTRRTPVATWWDEADHLLE